jgi:hypothetical protein
VKEQKNHDTHKLSPITTNTGIGSKRIGSTTPRQTNWKKEEKDQDGTNNSTAAVRLLAVFLFQ